MSEVQIREKFFLADTGGNGTLNPKEFKKLLKSFGIELTASEQDTLTQQFDVDGDGELDMNEFLNFIHSELAKLEGEGTGGGGGSPLPSPSYSGKSRPASAPQTRRYNAGEAKSELDELPSPGDYLPPPTSHENIKPTRPPSSSAHKVEATDKAFHNQKHNNNESNNIRTTKTNSNAGADADKSVDPHWIKNSLQAQAEVEAKLGGKYF